MSEHRHSLSNWPCLLMLVANWYQSESGSCPVARGKTADTAV